MAKVTCIMIGMLLFVLSISNSECKITPRMFCPPEFINLGNGCYHFSEHVVLNWNQALKQCQEVDRRSMLVNIGSAREWNNIKMYLRDHNLHLKNWWIGGSDNNNEGKWTWSGTNEPMYFSNWCPNEPNGKHHENCLHLIGKPPSGENLCWNDLTCNNPGTTYPTNFICEAQPY